MSIFKHILVPVDFSNASSGAIELAVEMAKAFDAELTLLHAWELPVYPYMEFILSSNELITAIEQAATQRLDQMLKSVQQRFPRAQSRVKMGLAWQQILETINELKPDLVVMGSHGRHGVSHALLGSVAEKIVRLSPVPVLTAHPRPAT